MGQLTNPATKRVYSFLRQFVGWPSFVECERAKKIRETLLCLKWKKCHGKCSLLRSFWFFVRPSFRPWSSLTSPSWFYDRNFYFRSVNRMNMKFSPAMEDTHWLTRGHGSSRGIQVIKGSGEVRGRVCISTYTRKSRFNERIPSLLDGMSSIRGNPRVADELCGFFGHKSADTMQRKRVVIYFTRVTVFLCGTVDNHAYAICNSRES